MKVRIQNYQTVKDTEIEISGFTVIVGKSNTGKTALLRAIEGAMFNDPVTGRVREGEKDTIVTVVHKDISWTWKKGENFNDYIVTTPKGTEHYSSVGRKSPNEIKDAGFREWRVDGEKARPQVAEWHQPIFLLNKPGKVVTELMTAVTRLDVVNLAIRNCSAETRKNRQTIKLRETDLKKAEQRAREYEPLKGIPVAEIESLWKDYQGLAEQVNAVDSFIVSYDKLTASIEGLNGLSTVRVPSRMGMALPDDITKLTKWTGKLGQTLNELNGLKVLKEVKLPSRVDVPPDIERLGTWARQLDKADFGLESLPPLDRVVVPDKYDGHLVGQVSAVTSYMARVVGVGTDLIGVKKQIKDLAVTLEAEKHKLHGLRGQLENCPVCGNSEVTPQSVPTST